VTEAGRHDHRALLTTTSAAGTTLTNANAVDQLQRDQRQFRRPYFPQRRRATLTITGATDASGGPITITNTGGITTTGAVSTATIGSVTLTSANG